MVPAAAQGDESAGTNGWIKNHPSRLLAAQAFAFGRRIRARLAFGRMAKVAKSSQCRRRDVAIV